MKLMILDGNSIINRAFYGIRMLNAPDGTPTNAVYGFLSTFRRVFDLAQPQAVCVAFDVHAPTFRHEQYALYKAQRSATPEDLIKQIDPIHRLIKALGLHLEVSDSCEADDCLASLAKRYREERPVILVATDKDLKQCLHDNVMMWDPASRDEKIVTLKSFEEETGLRPTQWPDVQAIIGDSSDNIPGVRGVG